MNESLGIIKHWFEINGKHRLNGLSHPASPDQIKCVEIETGLMLPDDFKYFLSQHNGENSFSSIFHGGIVLLNCDELIAHFKFELEADRVFPENPEDIDHEKWRNMVATKIGFIKGPVKPTNSCKQRLTIASQNGDVCRMIDYDPAPGGVPGQIVEIDFECVTFKVIASSFSDLTSKHATDLVQGKYIVNDDGDLEMKNEYIDDPNIWGIPSWLEKP